jgi:uncharacterized protein YggE
VKLGKITLITENTYVPGPIYRDAFLAKAEGAPAVNTSISPGELEVISNVQIVYEIE